MAKLRSTVAGLFRSAGSMVNDRANDDDTLRWVARNVDALRIAGYVLGALLLWFLDLTWLKFFLIALLVAAWQVAVAQLAGRAPVDEVPEDGAGPTEPPLAPPADVTGAAGPS